MAKTRRANRKGSRKASRRASRKGAATRKGGDWAASVKRVYAELKRKDPSARLGDAMKEASRRRKAGTL
jgi:hypothetical protein